MADHRTDVLPERDDVTEGWLAGPSLIAIQALIVVAAIAHILTVGYIADDGFISFRYARHLLEGDGVVYNVGERVEGYTNFLWVVLLAGVGWALPEVGIPEIARVAGTTAAVAVILLAYRLSTILSLGPSVGLLAGAFLAAHASTVAWAHSGLETTLFTMLVFAAAVQYESGIRRHRIGLGVPALLALAALTRPDGVLLFAAFVALCVFDFAPRPFSRRSLPGLVREVARFSAMFAAIYLPYFVWRYTYYGDLFPNTAYAKVDFDLSQLARGGRYVWVYARDYGVLAWIVPVCLFLFRERSAWSWRFAWLVAVTLTYVTCIGGDGLAFHRFIVPAAPMMYIIVAAALLFGYRRYLAPIEPRLARGAISAATVAGLLAFTAQATLLPILAPNRVRWFEPQSGLTFPGNGLEHNYVWFDNYFVDRLTIAARYLDDHAPAGSLIASTPAGAIGYYMDHSVLDMLGLTDRHIARVEAVDSPFRRAGHEKGDGDYVLSRSPDFILMGNVAVLPEPLDRKAMGSKLVLKSEHDLWSNPEFHERYELINVQVSNERLFRYFSFFRRRQ